MTGPLWIVAETEVMARRIAAAIRSGLIPLGARHSSETEARAWAAELAVVHARAMPVHAVPALAVIGGRAA